MIERYTRPEMGKIWEENNKFRIWLDIEVLACEAQAELGIVPREAVKAVKERARFDVRRIAEIESDVKHDVIAFLTNVGEYVGAESRFIHLGMTSSDVLDTALAVQMKQSAELLLEGLRGLHGLLRRKAKEFKHTVMVGRTHGVHAEPITFGLKLALWYAETGRNIERMAAAKKTIAVGQVSGAVGTYQHLDPAVERFVCKNLGLEPAPVSTQILQRDRHAEFMNTLAVCGSSLEKFATEIRHLQKTEVLEVEEGFSSGQKGSSAMPHKRNPIASENLMGLSRVMRANALAALEDVALWHERDISHSSVERIIAPDSTILLDYMLNRITRLVEHLVVYPEAMKANLERTRGLIFSESVLLRLVQKGLSREEAYGLVQKAAFRALRGKKDFRAVLMKDHSILGYLKPEEIQQCLDLSHSLRHVKTIFQRVFGKEK